MEIFWTVDTVMDMMHGQNLQLLSTHILILTNNITIVSALVFTVRKKRISSYIVSYFYLFKHITCKKVQVDIVIKFDCIGSFTSSFVTAFHM